MKISHPILIIEDDIDDCDLIKQAFDDIGIENEQKCFKNCYEALKYLQATLEKTFLILSDLNMPILNGLELKKEINNDYKLRIQSIPFVFLTTSDSKKDVTQAYDLLAQGFFTKPNDYPSLVTLLKSVTHYWDIAKHPN